MLSIDRDLIQRDIVQRWGILEWNKYFPWWRQPAKVRILMYADSPVRIVGGPFMGLQYVKTLLESRAYHFVDFDIATANRDGTDPSASIGGARRLTDLDIMNQYDQIWFFGFKSGSSLAPEEVTLLEQFMAAPKFGGVLATGDHANLGKGIAGQIPRAGKMRRYPAPPDLFPVWNTTLEEGPDPGATYDPEDQSDDRPQTVRFERFPVWSAEVFRRRYRPHPVMCGRNGPITLFPDHQHEGEALAPVPEAGDPAWPTKAGHQEQPYVVAWGRIKDPSATRFGKEIGLVSAYDGHHVDVGRIVADSTWHHWFDINLTGIAPAPSPYAGFDATPAGRAALTQIDSYFLNCGIWLSPPARQEAMRNAAWWSILWLDRVVELSSATSIVALGGQAIDALGLRAPRCTVSEWVFDFPIFKERIPRWEWPQLFDRFTLLTLPFVHYVAGGILRQLVLQVGPAFGRNLQFPRQAPADEALSRAIDMGIQEGLDAFKSQIRNEAALAVQLIDKDFRLPQSDQQQAGMPLQQQAAPAAQAQAQLTQGEEELH